MRRNEKNEKAITLIALVITIVVLLILAGVSINTLIGENGILNRSKNAAEEHKKQSASDKLYLAVTNFNMDRSIEGKEIGLEYLSEMNEKDIIIDTDENGVIINNDEEKELKYATAYVDGYELRVYENNVISVVGESDSKSKSEITISLDKTSISMQKESNQDSPTTKINATVRGANKQIKWSSSNEDIVTVDNTGLVTWKDVGIAEIIVSIADDTTISQTCKVTNSLKIVAEKDGWELKVTEGITAESTGFSSYAANRNVLAVEAVGGSWTYYVAMYREVDLTNVSKISATIYSYNDRNTNKLSHVGISSDSGANDVFINNMKWSYQGNGSTSGFIPNELEIDVSDLTGKYYIKLVAEHPNAINYTSRVGYSADKGILLEP